MNRALLCGKQHRTDLHATGTEGHGCLKLTVICDAAGRDDRNRHGVHTLRHQGHRRHLADMSAGLTALRDDGVRTEALHQLREDRGTDHRNHLDTGFLKRRHILSRISGTGRHHRHLLFDAHLHERLCAWIHQHEVYAEHRPVVCCLCLLDQLPRGPDLGTELLRRVDTAGSDEAERAGTGTGRREATRGDVRHTALDDRIFRSQ